MTGEGMAENSRGAVRAVRRLGGRRLVRGVVAFAVTAAVFGSGSVAAAPDVADSGVSSGTASGPPVADASPAVVPPQTGPAVKPAGADATAGSASAGTELESVASTGSASGGNGLGSAESVGSGPGGSASEVAERITVAGDPDETPRPLVRPVVVLYGDSLAWEARQPFSDVLAGRPGLHVITRTFGGTAICDWFDAMADDAAELAPGMVVLEFSGNSFTQCMRDAAGQGLTGAAVVDRYAADIERAIAVFTDIGAQVVLAGAPVSLAEAGRVGRGAGMNELYRMVALAHAGVRFVDAGSVVLADGHWTSTLPCLPAEPCTGGADAGGVGVNVVRSPDGLHFCPASAEAVRGVTGDCPVWASGAFRYGAALAAPVMESLDA